MCLILCFYALCSKVICEPCEVSIHSGRFNCFFFSQRLSQDPIEIFFGCIYRKAVQMITLMCLNLAKNIQTLHVVDSVCKPAVHGNCRWHRHNQSIDITKEKEHIPKRKKRRCKTL